MEKYIDLLIIQYLESIGELNCPLDSVSVRELADWLDLREEQGKVYLRFIKDLIGNSEINEFGMEVNKGGLDTITNNTPIAMISEFPYSLSSLKKVTNGAFLVQNGIPKIKHDNGFVEPILEYYNYLTQNPYNRNYIKGLDTLHNLGESVTLGIYGSITDSDIMKKKRELSFLEDRLVEPFISEGTTLGDTYLYVVTSKPKSRTRKKSV